MNIICVDFYSLPLNTTPARVSGPLYTLHISTTSTLQLLDYATYLLAEIQLDMMLPMMLL